MFKSNFFFVLLFLPLVVVSQDINWAISGGGWVNDLASDVKVDPDGNVIVCGFSHEQEFAPDIILDEAGVFIIKFNQNGEILWHYSFGGTSQLTVTGLEVDSEGNIYVTGKHYYSLTGIGMYIPEGPPNYITHKTYLIKLSNDGVVQWYNSYKNNQIPGVNSAGSFVPKGIAIDSQDNIYLGALFDRPVTINGELFIPFGSGSFYKDTYIIIKLDSEGNEQWITTGGNTSSNVMDDLSANDDGVFVLGSSSNGTYTFNNQTITFPAVQNRRQPFVVAFDTNGNPSWITSILRDFGCHGQSLALDSDGSVVGLIYGAKSIMPGTIMNYNAVFKLTSTGEIYFIQDIDSELQVPNYIYDIYQPSKIAVENGNIYVTDGFMEDFELGPISFSALTKEAGVLKLNNIGYPQWLKTLTGSSHDFGRAVAVSGDKVYAIGDFKSLVLDIGVGTLSNYSGNLNTDAFIIGVTDTTAIQCPDYSEVNVQFEGDSAICPSETVKLFIDADFTCTFDWYFNDSLLYSGVEDSIYVNEPGYYSAKINQGTACPTETDSLLIDLLVAGSNPDIIILPIDSVNLGQDTSVCGLLNFNITPLLLPGGGVYMWNTGASTSSVTVNNSGLYWLDYTNPWGCTNRDSIEITFYPAPTLNLGNTIVLEDYEPILLDAGVQPTGSSFLWDNGSVEQLRVVNESELNEGDNFFWVNVTNEYNCSTADTITVCVCSKIVGIPFFDGNMNGLRDANEPLYLDANLRLIPSESLISGTPDNGFVFYVPFGNYSLFLEQEDEWFITTNSDTVLVSINADTPYDTVYFGLSPLDTIYQGVAAVFAPPTRCSEPVTYSVLAKNFGTVAFDGILWFESDVLLGAPIFIDAPDTLLGQNLYGWHITDLYPGYSKSIQITFNVPGITTVNVGDNLISNAFISHGENVISTIFTYSSVVNCAYDPNDKLVYPDRPGNYTTFEETLLYTIRFQNTGNDFARNVLIRDTLDGHLNPSTFAFLGSSHSEYLTVILESDKFLSFYFNDIYLPDSTADFEGSQGFVSFLISPLDGLDEGTIIENSASIYMDFNPPIHTNTVENFMVSELPACEIWTLGASDFSCNDNNTPSNPTDDFIEFTLNPMGSNLWGSYQVEVENGSVYPETGNYGNVTGFRLHEGSAGKGNWNVSVFDNVSSECLLDFILEDPGFCLTSSSKDEPYILSNLDIVPNPSYGMVEVSLGVEKAESTGLIFLRDVNGRIIYKDSITGSKLLNLTELPAQMIFVEVILRNQICRGKLILVE